MIQSGVIPCQALERTAENTYMILYDISLSIFEALPPALNANKLRKLHWSHVLAGQAYEQVLKASNRDKPGMLIDSHMSLSEKTPATPKGKRPWLPSHAKTCGKRHRAPRLNRAVAGIKAQSSATELSVSLPSSLRENH